MSDNRGNSRLKNSDDIDIEQRHAAAFSKFENDQ